LDALMTGNPSRTARANPRGDVWRKLYAKSRPEVIRSAGEAFAWWVRPRSVSKPDSHSGPAGVDATGRREEGHESYHLRSARLPMGKTIGVRSRKASLWRAEVSRGQSSHVQRDERTEHVSVTKPSSRGGPGTSATGVRIAFVPPWRRESLQRRGPRCIKPHGEQGTTWGGYDDTD